MKPYNLSILLVCYFLSYTVVYSQPIDLTYGACTGCLQGVNSNPSVSSSLYAYDEETFQERDIESDFDIRNAGGSTRWHKGLDLRDHGRGGDQMRGDAIISPEDGTIVRLQHENYKYIVVDGDENDFGYGHLFWGSQSNTQSGGSYLKQLIEDDEEFWAIVLQVDGDITAIGPVMGQVIFKGDTLEVQNTISAGDPIGPTGGSSDGNELGPHLHLYSNPNGSSSINDEVTKNPLQYVDYADTTFEVKILKENDMDEGITLSYPGDASATTIQVRPVLKRQPTNIL